MALSIFRKVPGFYKNWKCHEDTFAIMNKFVCTFAISIPFSKTILILHHFNFQHGNCVQASSG